jgi:type II secretory pathway pseudopilin PulG
MEVFKMRSINQRGLTLIETALAISLAGVIVAGGIYMYSIGSKKSQLKQSIFQIEEIIKSIRTWRSNKSNYNTISDISLIQTGLLDTSVFRGNNIILKSGANVSIDPVVFNVGGTSSGFKIVLENLSYSDCLFFGNVDLDGKHFDTSISLGSGGSVMNFETPVKSLDLLSACDDSQSDHIISFRLY